MDSDTVEANVEALIAHETRDGYHLRLLRPFATGEERPRYASYLESILRGSETYKFGMTADQVGEFLAKQHTDNFLPRSLAAINHEDVLLFTAVCEPNQQKQEWDTDTNLLPLQLKAKTAEMAKKGFRPSCVTAYPWDGAVRYCVVWVKEPPRKDQPKKP